MSLLRRVIYGEGWKIRDAAGVERPLYDHLSSSGDPDPPVDQQTFNRIRRATDSFRASNWGSGPKWGMAFFVVWMIAGTSYKMTRMVRLQEFVGVVVWGGVIAAIVWTWQRIVLASPQNFAKVMLGHGHCASCGYALTPSKDGTTTCPECGAAWLSVRIGSRRPTG